MSRRRRYLIRSHARLIASRAVLVVAAIVILLGVVKGGTRFFYCPLTHLAFDAPPCWRGNDAADTDGYDDADAQALRTADCCQEKWRAAAPVASVPGIRGPSVAAASVVAVLPPPLRGTEIVAARMPFEIARAIRAGPPPLRASQRRAKLMVFNN